MAKTSDILSDQEVKKQVSVISKRIRSILEDSPEEMYGNQELREAQLDSVINKAIRHNKYPAPISAADFEQLMKRVKNAYKERDFEQMKQELGTLEPYCFVHNVPGEIESEVIPSHPENVLPVFLFHLTYWPYPKEYLPHYSDRGKYQVYYALYGDEQGYIFVLNEDKKSNKFSMTFKADTLIPAKKIFEHVNSQFKRIFLS